MSRARGFTLVELLVTVSLLVVVMMTVTGMMMGGLRVYKRSEDYSTTDQHLVLAFETIRRDLHNARRFKPVSYEGSYDQFVFPGTMPVDLTDGSTLQEMGRVGYFLEARSKSFCRSRQPYRVVRSRSIKDACDPLVSGVERIRFEYYVPDASGAYGWTGSWSSEEPPLAVKVELRLIDGSSKKRQTRSAIVYVPVAHVEQKR